MNLQSPHVVRVTSLADFMAEVPPGLSLAGAPTIVRISNTRIEGEHVGLLTLNLQAVNARGEIVWLSECHRASWLFGKPFGKDAETMHDGMGDLERIVRAWLTAQGYTLRAGDYGLPDNIKPLAAQFECARWHRDEDTNTYSVQSVGPSVITGPINITRVGVP